ncbi:MAG: 6-phosphogluconolactonase [Mangrovibacterium sp.]
MIELKISETREELAKSFARDLFQLVSQTNGYFHLALSGGSTPRLLFDHLSHDYASRMPWEKIHFWWGDERCVPPSDAESNYRMTYDHLLGKIDFKPDHIHRIKGELTPGEACRLYRDEIRDLIPVHAHLPLFDLIILGIGDDGHTASIFPDQMDLLISNETCAIAVHPQSGQKRVTLTGPVLNNARQVSFLVTGTSKATRIAQIINKENSAAYLPASHIQPAGLSFYLDHEAASGIK